MHEFTTAVKAVEEGAEDKPVEFKIDGQEMKAYKPKDGQLAMLLASTGRGAGVTDMVAGTLNFFVAVLDDASASYIENRLLDRDDDFEIEQVQEVMEWLIEQWSGHPTQQPSGSPQLQPSGGPNLMPPTSGSIF